MDGKFLARIGAAALVGLAIAMALVQLRGEPPERAEPSTARWVPDDDPFAAQLRRCGEMGELALSSPDCRAAWAEKRRRFFGVDHRGAYSGIAPDRAPARPGGD